MRVSHAFLWLVNEEQDCASPSIVFLFFSSLLSMISCVRPLLVCAEKLMMTGTRSPFSCRLFSRPFAITDYSVLCVFESGHV